MADAEAMNNVAALKALLSTLSAELGMHIIAGPEVVAVGPNFKKTQEGYLVS